MPRPLRKHIEDATYHIFTRCINSSDLIRNDAYKEILLKILQATQEKYAFDLVFYQILDNHIHLVIRTRKGEASISRIIQYFKARFAEQFNRKNNRTGPFWNERFGDVIVDLQESPVFYLLWLLWYLAYNAVRKNKVRDPRKYHYGSISQYLDQNSYDNGKVRITHHQFFINLGDSFTERVMRFLLIEDMYRKRLGLPV